MEGESKMMSAIIIFISISIIQVMKTIENVVSQANRRDLKHQHINKFRLEDTNDSTAVPTMIMFEGCSTHTHTHKSLLSIDERRTKNGHRWSVGK